MSSPASEGSPASGVLLFDSSTFGPRAEVFKPFRPCCMLCKTFEFRPMTGRRRRGTNTSRRPAVNRLPVGTPMLDRMLQRRSPPPSSEKATGNHPVANIPSSGVDGGQPLKRKARLTLPLRPDMSSNLNPSALSIAEAKLLRQNERIEQAEAARVAVSALERTSPTKVRAGKTSELRGIEGLAPVRLNTRSPAAAEPTLGVEMERQDSTVPNDQGFRIYTGRKHKRPSVDIGMAISKAGSDPVRVQAEFDKREIQEVFGKELPGPEYLQQAEGLNDGQVMFVQHTNADVSAHQWSDANYQWANIGQFSNVRKRIEGQMATDRLKGETTRQSLQQNTMAYFRTIAKQREAVAMGRPMGVKEIRQTLSDSRSDPLKSSSGMKHVLQATALPFTSSIALPHSLTSTNNAENHPLPAPVMTTTTSPPSPPRGPRRGGYGATAGSQLGRTTDDPFVSGHPYIDRDMYSPSAFPRRSGRYQVPQQNHTTTYRHDLGTATTALNTTQSTYRTSSWHQTTMLNPPTGNWNPPPAFYTVSPTLPPPPPSASHHHFPQSPAAPTYSSPSQWSPQAPETRGLTNMPQARSQATRTAMRDRLRRVGQAALERSHGQGGNLPASHAPAMPLSQDAGSIYRGSVSRGSMAGLGEINSTGLNTISPYRGGSLPNRGFSTPHCLERLISSSAGGTAVHQRTESDRLSHHRTPDSNSVTEPQPRPSERIEALIAQQHSHSQSKPTTFCMKTWNEEFRNCWKIKDTRERQKVLHRLLIERPPPGVAPRGPPPPEPDNRFDASAIFIPIIDNLMAYKYGPHDYWCRWRPSRDQGDDRNPPDDCSVPDDRVWRQPPAHMGHETRNRELTSSEAQHATFLTDSRLGGWPAAAGPYPSTDPASL